MVRKCFIHRLPNEILVHILAHLDPSELVLLYALIFRNVRRVLRVAGIPLFQMMDVGDPLFKVILGGCRFEELQLEVGDENILLERGYSSEFEHTFQNFDFDREWSRGRQVLQFEPRIGKIEQAFVDLDDGKMYAGSLEKGAFLLTHLYAQEWLQFAILSQEKWKKRPSFVETKIGCLFKSLF